VFRSAWFADGTGAATQFRVVDALLRMAVGMKS
jgi:hypothetical protein